MWRRIEREMTLSPSASAMPRTPIDVRPWNTRTSVTAKRIHCPPAVVSNTSSRSVQICTSTMPSPSSSFMAMMPERRTSTKSDSLLRRTVPRVVANITSSSLQLASSSGSGMTVVTSSPGSSGRMLISALPRACGAALAAAPLRAIGRERHALDVAKVRNRDHHVLAVDEIFFLHLAFLVEDDGPSRCGKLLAHGSKLVLHDALNARARAQDVEIVGDLLGELVELGLDLVAAKRGQALQAQVEDRFGLLGRELVSAGRRYLVPRIVDQRDHRLDLTRRPVTRHQRFACHVGVGGSANELDHLVDIADGNGEPDQHMGAIARLAEQILGAPRNYLLAEGDEGGEQVLEIHHQRATALEGDDIGAEGRLQRRVAVELVEHDVRHSLALELDDDAIAVAVGLVAQRGDTVDLLVAP